MVGNQIVTQLNIILVLAGMVVMSVPAYGLKPSDDELSLSRKWIADHFKKATNVKANTLQVKAPETGLTVIANYGPVQQNERDGNPLSIGDKTFSKGLYCHARSSIFVRLPSPGKTFTAFIGGETNGSYSNGSMDFIVSAGDKELYHSPVMLRGQPGIPISVNIGGRKDFTIKVSDGGDGINSDQACWGDAKVVLENGEEVSLGDMRILQSEIHNRTASTPPFSFEYDGKSSDELLGSWKFSKKSTKLDENRSQTTHTYTDPKTGLQVKCVIVEYKNYPTIEWTLYFANTGKSDTPIISNVNALDTWFTSSGNQEFVLHNFVGSLCAPNDYQPLVTNLSPKTTKRITTLGGRPTNSDLPYFNIETGNGGVIAVIGWAGQWAADFIRNEANGLRICGSQELTRFKLHPGEEVRAPMTVLQFYKGDWIRSQNIWRSWMLAYNTPKLDGKPIRPISTACNGNLYPGIITNAAEEIKFLRRYVEEDVVPDFWWQDAGWYPCGNPPNWALTGTWEVEKTRWPKGIREVSDWCKTQGIRTLVWFEPERCGGPGTWLYDNHKDDWLLGGALLNLGNKEAREWLINHIDKLLTEQGIHLYRQDFNIDPLGYWRANDADDRQGITEMKHVEGYLAYWDELKRRHNDMLIDSCASGGRRNDLETLRRAVPMLRSDYVFQPVAGQCRTYGLSFWMPYNGDAFMTIDKYMIRSNLAPEFEMGIDTRDKNLDYDLFRKLFNEWKQVSPCFLGDYWPLTSYSLENNVWMGFQFDRPDLGRGFFQAFRRADCPDESVILKLQGLEKQAKYIVTDLDNPTPRQLTGAQLMKGFAVESKEKPAALIFTYEKQ